MGSPASTRPGPLDVTALVREHQAGVWRYLRALGCASGEAEELTQDTFVSVLQRPFREINARATAGYLRTVARNLLRKARRSAGRGLPLDPTAPDPDALDAAMARAVGDDGGAAYVTALRECVDALDVRDRELLDRCYREGQSRAALAGAFALSEDGIKSWLRRTRVALRACVEGKVER